MKKSPLTVIFFVVFIDLVGFGIILPLGPYLGTQLGASPFQIGLLMAIYSIMQFIFAPIWGRLSDIYGRRPIILISLLGGAIAHLIYALSNDVWMMFLGRGFAGLFGGNISAAMAYISDVTDEKNRSKGMGIIGAAFGVGFILGPPLGGLLGELGTKLGDHPPFGMGFSALGASLICFLNFIFAIKVLKESLTPEVRKKLPKRESRFILLRRFMFKPVLGLLLILNFLVTFAMANMEATLGLLVKNKWDWDLKKTGFAFAYIGLIHVITQGFLIRKMMPRLGEARMMLLGIVLTTLGLTGIGISGTVTVLAVAVTLLGFGNGFFNPSLLGSVSLKADPQDQGGVMGVQQSFSALGRIVGPAVGGYIFGHYGQSVPFFLAGAVGLMCVLIVIALYKRLPHSGMTRGH